LSLEGTVFLHQGFFGQLKTQCDEPEDGMQDIEMVVVSERVKFGREWAKGRGMRTCGDVTIDPILLNLVPDIVLCIHLLPRSGMNWRDRLGRKYTCPVPTRLVPNIVADFPKVGGVELLFFRGHSRKWHICDVEYPIALSLGIAMVDCIDEAVGMKGIAKLWCELSASLGSVRFGQVDDR
jgi:hypothetical protein